MLLICITLLLFTLSATTTSLDKHLIICHVFGNRFLVFLFVLTLNKRPLIPNAILCVCCPNYTTLYCKLSISNIRQSAFPCGYQYWNRNTGISACRACQHKRQRQEQHSVKGASHKRRRNGTKIACPSPLSKLTNSSY